MSVKLATDILIRDDPNRDRLRLAVSRAFGVAPGFVTVTEATGDEPIPEDVMVLLLHQPEIMPGDFPTWYDLSVSEGLLDRIEPAISAVAHELGTIIVTDADDYFEMTLHLPDGTRHTVELYQGDDDAFRITPEIRRLIDQAGHHVSVR